MINVKATVDIGEDGKEGPLHLILEATGMGDDELLLSVKMDSPNQADDMIAALKKCREYIWGPMPNGKG